MLKTRITELFGIEKPIVQGGLMWIARAELAAAVGNAGGIGFMTALTFPEADQLRAEIHNPIVDKVLDIESKGDTKIEDIAPMVSGLVGKQLLEDGDMEKGVLSAGQIMGLVRDIPTCQELFDRIMAEAEGIIKNKFAQVLN